MSTDSSSTTTVPGSKNVVIQVAEQSDSKWLEGLAGQQLPEMIANHTAPLRAVRGQALDSFDLLQPDPLETVVSYSDHHPSVESRRLVQFSDVYLPAISQGHPKRLKRLSPDVLAEFLMRYHELPHYRIMRLLTKREGLPEDSPSKKAI